jgi:hypothetical protein
MSNMLIHFLSNDIDSQSCRNDPYLRYGSEVILECQQPYLISHVFIIRKVEKTKALLDTNEPVFQLQKVCFCLKEAEDSYLAIINETISIRKAIPSSDDSNFHLISDACAWTIVQTGTLIT